ncbi:hypothetical protein TW80_14015 [Loktanella sp. S4079]|nr:hypothetical protein TW80_14015 [Loktanella sp. S4079]
MLRTCFIPLLVLAQGAAAGQSCGPYSDEESANNYVTLSAGTYPAAEQVFERIGAIANPFEAMVPLKAYGDFMQMGVLDLALPTIGFGCNYDLFDANGCAGSFFLPSNVTSATMTGDSLSFSMTNPDTQEVMTVTHKNRAYDRTVVSVPRGETTWERAADGTETFLSIAVNGDETGYIEHPDCSGSGHVIRHNEMGLLSTNHFSWSAATGQAMTFQYKICRHQDPDPGCHEGQI